MLIILFSCPVFAASDVELTQKAEKYLNSLSTFSADFTQVDSEGATSGGKFLLKRPGKFKWEYDARQPILIVSDGLQLVYYDKKLKEASYVSADSSLASFLARKNIRLSGDINLVSIIAKDMTIRAKVVQKGKPDQGSLVMIFNNTATGILGLEVQGINGFITKITFSNQRAGMEIGNKEFNFHDPKNSKNAWEK